MAYGLRYTITQILRNGNNQVVEVYEKDYTAGVIKIYKPSSIILQPNSSVEYPSPSIISSQLNFSILLETQDDYDQFPNVLTQDDRKYYVILKENSTIMWRGFIFNDFSQMGYSTGITQADFVCVDGISFLQSIVYVKTRSINELTTHLDLISTALNKLLYPDNINLISACSYFAQGMVNRTDNVTNEPFTQIYQYVRDFIGESYYDIINNIMVSFNCRLFQANGDWWIASMNEMAATTNYYTKYTLSPTPVLVTGGVLNNTINIQPYADGNVHFINNSQSKILKKGFYNIQGRGAYESALNYTDNANLKINDGSASAEGFVTAKTGTGNVYLIINTNQQFDEYFITSGSGTGTASIETGNALYPYLYIPYIGDIPYNLSFDTKAYNTVYCQVKLITSVGNVWLDSTNHWSSTTQNITIPQTTDGSYNSFSVSMPVYIDPLYLPTIIPRMGYLQIKILTSSGSITVRNFILQRGSYAQNNIKYIEANYNAAVGLDSTLKIFEQPYGNNYPSSFDYSSNKGVLCDSTGKYLKNWYSSTSTNFPSSATDLITFMTYQNIRNLNQNIATIECDLGSFKDSGVGYVYLDKVFTSTDTITGNLSYTGKKFIINRLSQNTSANEVNSVQLIEVSEKVLDTFIIPTYITDIAQFGPFWFVNITNNIT
jgi:hypothetical protein